MRGLAVIGTGSNGDELAVAGAVVHALREAGERVDLIPAAVTGGKARAQLEHITDGADEVLEQEATPFIAARHAGVALDPDALAAGVRAAAEAGDAVVVATSGGPLAPLSRHYFVRDLAAALSLNVVVAVPADADVVNDALLTVEAARGVGLTVAAIAVSAWPATPGRVLLDETELLGELAPAPVVTLPSGASPTAASWPVFDWLAAAPARGASVPVTLEPYSAWEPRPVGDPRATPRPQIMAALLEIVGAEGPMRASRAYAVYNRAGGGRKLTSVARAPLSSALYWLARERSVVITRADDIPWQGDDLVRMPDSPPVRVRELGPRTLEEVPLDEVAELIGRLRRSGAGDDPTALKRAVLGTYGLVRLTSRADEYLGLALDLADPSAP